MSLGLQQLGYDLEPTEVAILMQQLDLNADGQVRPAWAGWAGPGGRGRQPAAAMAE